MAVATAGGMTTSTVMTLFVVPVVYALLDRWFHRKGKTEVVAEEG
jgi:Cu/Ag efflux pump CusA